MKPTKNKDVVLFCCHEHVLETMSVELHGRSHPAHNAARMVRYTEHRPCGCQGMKSYRVPQGGMVSKVSMSKAVIILQVLVPQGSRDPGSMVRFQGFNRSPFMDLVSSRLPKGHTSQGLKGWKVFSPCYPRLSKGLMFSNPKVSGSKGRIEGLTRLTGAF